MPIVLNGSGPVTGVTSLNTTVSDTELGYLDGVTSALQSQINTAGGLVKITDSTFSASSAVNVNDCFSSTYDNYRLMLDYTMSTTMNVLIRLRVSGSDASGTNYVRQDLVGYSTTTSASIATLQTSWPINGLQTRQTQIFDIFGPNKAAETWATRITHAQSSSDRFVLVDSLRHDLSTAYTGFSILTSTGTITGQVRVYGYRN